MANNRLHDDSGMARTHQPERMSRDVGHGTDMNEHPHAAYLRDQLLDPKAWTKAARHLLDAVRLLKPKVDEYWSRQTDRGSMEHYVSIFMMLCSYTIENLLKALIVFHENATIRSRLEQGKSFNSIVPEGHMLCRLARRAGLSSLVEEHAGLLRRLSRSAVWHARYPAPLKPEGFETEDFFGLASDQFVQTSAYSSADVANAQKILTAIQEEMSRLNGQQGAEIDALGRAP